MESKPKPIYHNRVLGDINFEKINYDTKANFIIERVFERGDVEDIRNCRRYYGDQKITSALLNAKYLSKRRMYLASAVIDKPISEFRCFKSRKSNENIS